MASNVVDSTTAAIIKLYFAEQLQAANPRYLANPVLSSYVGQRGSSLSLSHGLNALLAFRTAVIENEDAREALTSAVHAIGEVQTDNECSIAYHGIMQGMLEPGGGRGWGTIQLIVIVSVEMAMKLVRNGNPARACSLIDSCILIMNGPVIGPSIQALGGWTQAPIIDPPPVPHEMLAGAVGLARETVTQIVNVAGALASVANFLRRTYD